MRLSISVLLFLPFSLSLFLSHSLTHFLLSPPIHTLTSITLYSVHHPRPTPYVPTPSPCFRDARRGRKIPKSREACLVALLSARFFIRFLRILLRLFAVSSFSVHSACSTSSFPFFSQNRGKDASETFARNSQGLSVPSWKFRAFLRVPSNDGSDDKVEQSRR